ncbi:MAG: hypothetical protein DME22_24875 [Verrucomicrobia bacterium]|nr:MAG: hypothetical protein DME22_24875 [Verrucomicrobiota bacterium]
MKTNKLLNQSVSLGATTGFRVTATTTNPPLNFQWRFNAMELGGQTTNAVTLTNIQTNNAGGYDVVVADVSGSITSQVATLTVDTTFTKITTGSIVTDKNDYWNGSWADYDNDGYLDLFVGTWFNSKTNYLYHNNGDRTFTRVPPANIPKIPSNQHGASWGDFDNDGYLDLIVTAGNPEITHNVIYRNNGDGTFTPIKNGRIYNETTAFDVGFHGPSWVDYNNDGFLDLFVAGHTPQNHLWRNNGDGSFTKIIDSAVVRDSGDSEGRAWVDYDNDGFTKITNSVLTSMVDDSTACAWGDYDNDGYLDVFLANGLVTHRANSLYKNNGDGTFTKIIEGDIVSGLVNVNGDSLSCAWGDYDNDGYIDLFVAQGTGAADVTRLVKNQLYHNNGNGTFTRIMEGSLVNDPGRSHGPVWVDYDNDGFLDLFIANGGFWAQNNGGALLTNFLYRNNGNSNNWITIRLVGTVSNRSAIGAKVRVQATIRGKTMWQVRQIFGGDSQANEQPLDAHFGLSDATNVDLVHIEWPSGIVQTMTNAAPKQFLTVVEHQEAGAASLNFTSVSRSTNGAADLSVIGDAGLRYLFEASTNLMNWSWLGVRTNLTGSVQLSDTAATHFPQRFYRVSVP